MPHSAFYLLRLRKMIAEERSVGVCEEWHSQTQLDQSCRIAVSCVKLSVTDRFTECRYVIHILPIHSENVLHRIY